MTCAEKVLEPTILFNLYTKSPWNSGSESLLTLRHSVLKKPHKYATVAQAKDKHKSRTDRLKFNVSAFIHSEARCTLVQLMSEL